MAGMFGAVAGTERLLGDKEGKVNLLVTSRKLT
jgi:hypothetical protein